jgi:nicotinate-nucleotide adenylyltransferase
VDLGLFGGTFNPIHLGHLRAAVEVQEAFDLDKILLIPSAVPPHKKAQEIAGAEERLEMVRLAVQDVPSLEASDVELGRPGPSYTVETLHHFQNKFGTHCVIYFIVGIDAFFEITTWRAYLQLFSLAHFIILARPGGRIDDLGAFILKHISREYEQDRTRKQYRHPEWRTIFSLHVTHMDISATQIRARIKEGRSVRFLVPPQVEDYIQKKGLYR